MSLRGQWKERENDFDDDSLSLFYLNDETQKTKREKMGEKVSKKFLGKKIEGRKKQSYFSTVYIFEVIFIYSFFVSFSLFLFREVLI